MKAPRNKRILLIVSIALFWFCQYAYVPYMSENLLAIGATATFIGFVFGSYGYVQLIARIPLGIAADITKKHKLLIILGMALNLLAALGMYLTSNGVLYMLFRAQSGLAASTWVSYTVLYISYFEADHTAKSVATINVSNNIGRFAAFTLGGFAAQLFGIKAPFFVSFLAGFIGLILTFFVLETKIESKPSGVKELFKVGLNKQLLISSLLCAASQFIVFATALSFTSNYASSVGATKAELGLLTSVFVMPMIFGSYLSGSLLLKKFGPRVLIAFSFALLTVYVALMPLCSSTVPIYLLQSIGGFGNGIVFALLMAHSLGDIDPQKKSTAMGFFQSIYSLGMTFGPITMGVLVDNTNFQTSFIALAVVSVAAIIITLLFVKRKSTE